MNSLWNILRRTRWLAWLTDNPLLVREVRRRMRGRLFSWSLIGYVLALGVVSVGIMWVNYPRVSDNVPLREMIQRTGQIGFMLGMAMYGLEGFIALVVAPMLTAGLATAEKEKDTFDFLRVTSLSSTTFVIGCLLTTACFLMLVFACTLPVLGLTFIFGGVSMRQILSFNGVLFLCSLAICALGVFFSTHTKRAFSMIGSMSGILILGVILLASYALRVISALLFGGRSISMAGGPAGQVNIWWALFYYVGLPSLVTLCFGIAASRRLYEPNNRLFSYRQYGLFYVLAILSLVLFATLSGGSVSVEDRAWAYIMVGGCLLIWSVLIFSSGRIERGDEVWNIRVRYPAFQRIPEDILFHLALGGLYVVGAAALLVPSPFDILVPDDVRQRIFDAMLVLFMALVFLFSLARWSTGVTDQRRTSTKIIWATVAILWAALPPIMMALREWFEFPPESLLDALPVWISPPRALQLINRGEHLSGSEMICLCITQTILSILFYMPLRSNAWQKKLAVSYRWIERPTAAVVGEVPSN